MLGEQGLIYIGDATFVSGARPDVEAGYPQLPAADRGGWGFMLLTNMLPDVPLGQATGGNGTFRLHAYAIDAGGQAADLGCEDHRGEQPHRRQAVRHDRYAGPGRHRVGHRLRELRLGARAGRRDSDRRLDDDGARRRRRRSATRPTTTTGRTSPSAFPGHANSNGAIAFFILDTTHADNGVHTISWVVTDNAGNTSGLGSRFFNVLNTSAATARQAAERAAMTAAVTRAGATTVSTDTVAALPVENTPIEVSRVAATDTTPQVVMPEWSGEIRLRSREAEPIAINLASEWDTLGGVYQGFLR